MHSRKRFFNQKFIKYYYKTVFYIHIHVEKQIREKKFQLEIGSAAKG